MIAFARSGDPNHAGIPQWEACTPEKLYTLITSKQTQVACNYDDDLMRAMLKYRPDRLQEQKKDAKIQH